MKILLINGSPKGKRSNSLKLAYSFIEGFKNGCTDDEGSISIDELHVASMNIAACKGCFACWQKTPGICCIKDDMQDVLFCHPVCMHFPEGMHDMPRQPSDPFLPDQCA